MIDVAALMQVGHLPANIDIPWRQSAMTGDVTPLGADLTGGWITGSEAGAASRPLSVVHSASDTVRHDPQGTQYARPAEDPRRAFGIRGEQRVWYTLSRVL